MTGIYDLHSHILPNIDDGSSSLEETEQMLRKEYQDGVRVIFSTSHYRKGMFEPDLAAVMAQYEKVRVLASSIASDLTILLGCEFHANMNMTEMLNNKERPTLNNTEFVLTEFSARWWFDEIRERCNALLVSGYTPIIAHPERYPDLCKDMDNIRMLVNMGVYMQVNAGSIIGEEGRKAKKFCKKLMKENLLHFVGSDAHNMGDRPPMMKECADYMTKLMGEEYTRKILIENPEEIILNKYF